MNYSNRKTFNPPLKVFSTNVERETGANLSIDGKSQFIIPGMKNAVANERIARYFRKPNRATHSSLTDS